MAAVASTGSEDVVPHGVDSARRVCCAAVVVEAERVERGVLQLKLVQVEADVWRVGERERCDPAAAVHVEAVGDLLHELDLLREVLPAHGAGRVDGECDVCVDAAGWKWKNTRVRCCKLIDRVRLSHRASVGR